jgi:hypothetical protein
MRIYVEVEVTEDEVKEMYQRYMDEYGWSDEEPLDYEEFRETELTNYTTNFISENSESVENYLEGDWLKIVEE